MSVMTEGNAILRAVISGTTDAVFVKDLNGHYRLVNEAFGRFVGKSPDEIVGLSDSDLYPPETAAQFILDDKLVLESGETQVSEGTATLASGISQSYRVTKGVIRDFDGSVIGTFGISHDMTDRTSAEEDRLGRALEQAARKQAEADSTEKDRLLRELREAQARLNLAIRAAEAGYWYFDSGSGNSFWSDECWRLFGLEPGAKQITLKLWLSLIAAEDRDAFEQAINTALESRSDLSIEYRIQHRTRGRRWLLTTGSVISAPDEEFPRLTGVTLDMTRRRRAEESVARYQLLSQQARDILLFVKADGRIVEANQAAVSAYGFDHETLLTLNIGDLRAPDTVRLMVDQLREADECGISFETVHVRSDGSVFPVEVSAIGADLGSERLILSIVRDVSERKRVERERDRLLERERLARADAEQANRLKDEFLATLSHELRTPLTSIIGWVHLLKSGDLDIATAKHGMLVIERNANVQRQLIEDVLDISRIITGNLKFEIGPVDLIAVVQAAMDSVRPAADAKRIVLKSSFDPAIREITGDASRLQQVIWNLLSNAVKFTTDNGIVRIDLVPAGSEVRIIVTDSGKGISREFLPFVFDRFRQEDGSHTRTHGGLGLGLSIVRQLVEAHGGTVKAVSDGAGKGSTFTVSIPVKSNVMHSAGFVSPELSDGDRAQQSDLAAPGSLAKSRLLAGVRIVIVDDDEDALEMIAHLLRNEGAEVVTRLSAETALNEIEHQQPNLIISDIGMPGQDGFAFMRNVRQLLTNDSAVRVPAIALTAYAGEADKIEAIRAGYDRHMPKPVDPAELVRVIAALLASR